MAETDFQTTFCSLRAILEPLAPRLVTVHDTPENFYLDTAHFMENGKPLFFGSVRIGRRYVSFHLMPVYLWPELLDDVPAVLKRRMQGKSCFNFTSVDPALEQELTELVRRGFDRYREEGYVA
jgi:hypothetical protein